MGYSSTNIHFDYDGQYAKSGDDYEWIPSDGRLYGISFKTSSLDEITYSCLKERICKKKRIDPCLKRMNLSYIPLGRRSILHVEVIEEMEQQSVVEKESSYGGNYSELASGLPEVEGNPGALTLFPRIEEAELYLPGAERVENVVINGKAEERGINVVNGEAEERGINVVNGEAEERGINVVNGEAEERGINVVNGEAGEGGVDSEGDVDKSMGVRPSSCFKNLRVKKL
ncbi:SWIM-type domain-containing protein [Raphanus sativus]|nr:SWIM-type domain-containing protein [Raphanus sativus]